MSASSFALPPNWDKGQMGKGAFADSETAFGTTLRGLRCVRYVSQSRLGELAGFDHSYVSRLESGTRMPTRQVVTLLSDALKATDDERTWLMESAGFIVRSVVEDPRLRRIAELLGDPAITTETKSTCTSVLNLVIATLEREQTA